MNPDIKIIIDFVRGQMDGAAVPAQGTSEEQALSSAVGNLLRHKSPGEQEFLGLELLSVVIARMRGTIAAEKALRAVTLRAFTQRGGGHA